MKTLRFATRSFDRTTLVFISILIVAGSALLLGSRVGLLSLEQMEKFWPVSLVAAGLVQLLSAQGSKDS